jgi:hypothetical protein
MAPKSTPTVTQLDFVVSTLRSTLEKFDRAQPAGEFLSQISSSPGKLRARW